MLKDIRGNVGHEKIYLFFDNASFHKVFNDEEVKKEVKEEVKEEVIPQTVLVLRGSDGFRKARLPA